MLPTAVQHGWVSPPAGPTITCDCGRHRPEALGSRPVFAAAERGLGLAGAVAVAEESSVDAPSWRLALHQYKSLPATSAALRSTINRVAGPPGFAAFACPAAGGMAYRYATPRSRARASWRAPTNGYTTRPNIVSLGGRT